MEAREPARPPGTKEKPLTCLPPPLPPPPPRHRRRCEAEKEALRERLLLEAEEKARESTKSALEAQERRIRGEAAAMAAKDSKRREKQVGGWGKGRRLPRGTAGTGISRGVGVGVWCRVVDVAFSGGLRKRPLLIDTL